MVATVKPSLGLVLPLSSSVRRRTHCVRARNEEGNLMATKSLAQQLARAAWIAPLVAFGFNFFSKNIPNRGPLTSLIIVGVAMLLFLAGVVCAVLAFAKKAPKEAGVIVPATVGLVISVICILLVGSVLISNIR